MSSNHKQTKLITAKQVQEEYLPVDIRKVRAFLNAYCRYRKIGSRYYYIRKEVEEKLIQAEGNVIYRSKSNYKRRQAK